MTQIDLKYTQLLGKAMTYNVLATVDAKSFENKSFGEARCKKGKRYAFKMIESKKLYGSTLLVEKLMNC